MSTPSTQPPPTPVTPIHFKTEESIPWRSDVPMFYVLAGNGLFLCRNHEFFRSCVPAPRWPSGLETHEPRLELAYPKIPRELFEAAVGFFDCVKQAHGSEAGVLLAWDRAQRRMEMIVPLQRATVSRSWSGNVYPIGLHYETPDDLPADWAIIGDIHSHVDEAAYASGTDKRDETHRAGLHVVVGRLYRDPPQIHVEAVIDGTRFELESDDVLEGYETRLADVPAEWLQRVTVDPPPRPKREPDTRYGSNGRGDGRGNGRGNGQSFYFTTHTSWQDDDVVDGDDDPFEDRGPRKNLTSEGDDT
jgi:hypothetical protein